MQCQFLIDQIAATKALILAYNEASLAFSSTNVLSYTIDTGQTRQTVQRQDASSLVGVLDGLYNRLATLEARAGMGGQLYVGPAF